MHDSLHYKTDERLILTFKYFLLSYEVSFHAFIETKVLWMTRVLFNNDSVNMEVIF